MRDAYSAYDSVLDATAHPRRIAAGCAAHARRKFDELVKTKASAIAPEAPRRFADIYRIEREFTGMTSDEHLAKRHELTRPLWDKLHSWHKGERQQVPDGIAPAKAMK